jgi:hypothetical protein
MKHYILVLETKDVIAKFPYTDKEFATKRFEENVKSNKFTKVELIVEEENSFDKVSELPF